MKASPALQCACCTAENDLLMSFVARSDELIAKALAVPEVARIARAEVRLREYLLLQWRARAKQAAQEAVLAYKKGFLAEGIVAAVDAVMKKFPGDVEKRFKEELATSYKLARRAGWKKAAGHTTASLRYHVPSQKEAERVAKARGKIKVSLEPTFNLQDERALASLEQDQMLWVGQHYGPELRAAVLKAVHDELTKGYGRADIAPALEKAVQKALGYSHADAAYFEGLAANVVTTARVKGQMISFVQLDVVTYELVNPMDERTSEICEFLNGKQFSVEDGLNHLSRLAAATSPEDVKSIAPWLSIDEIKQISSGPGQQSEADSKALAAAGVLLPPFHFRCRTTIDIVG